MVILFPSKKEKEKLNTKKRHDSHNQKLSATQNVQITKLDNILSDIEYKDLILNFLKENSVYEYKDEEFHIKPKKSLNVKHEVRKIKIYDIVTNSLKYNEWSGLDVLENQVDRTDSDSVEFYNSLINKMQELMSKLIYKDW